MKPRPYQEYAHDSVFKEWKEHRSHTLEMATGTGENNRFFDDPQHAGKARKNAGLSWHTVMSLSGRLWTSLGGPRGFSAPLKRQMNAGTTQCFPVVVILAQTLMRQKRLNRFLTQKEFDVIITDEAHHALANSSVGIFSFPHG